MRCGCAVVGAVLIGMLLIGAAVVAFFGWIPWVWTSQQHRAEIDAEVVRLALGSGDVSVRRGTVEQIQLVAHTRSWQGEDRQSWRRDGDVLVLDDCGWRCSVDYELVVPPDTRVDGRTGSGSVIVDGASAVEVETGSGSLDISNVTGAVRAATGSGSVSLARIGGASTARSSSGSIIGQALAGPVDADTSSGDIILELTRRQDVRAETSSGDVELTVPAGSYRVDTHSSTSDDETRIEVVDDPNAQYSLELSTSSGTIMVRER